MSAPNPLIPQGTFQAQAVKGASNVRLAVATIVAIHVVFFGGLLLQGCKRDPKLAEADASQTNSAALTNLSLAPIDSNSLYYASGSLPPDSAPNGGGSATSASAQAPSSSNAESLWQSSNLVAAPVGNAAESNTPTKEYTIVKGDSFGRIAKMNNTTVSALRKANPGVDPVRIRPGQKINVPEASQNSPITALNTGEPAHSGSAPSANTYTVKSGDTLTKIANNYKISVRELRAANNMNTSRVNVGQKLKIPAKGSGAGGALPTNASAGAGTQVF